MNNKLVKKIVAIGLGTTLAVGTLVAPATLGIGTSVNAQATVEYGPFHTLLDGKIDALIKEAAKHDKKAMDALKDAYKVFLAKKALFEAKNKDKKGYPYPENLGDSEVVNLLNAFNAAKASKAEVKKDDSKKDSKKVTIDEWNAAEKKKEEAAKKAAEEEAKKPVNVVLKQFKDAVKKAEEILKNKEKYNYGVVTKVEKLLPQVKALNLKASTLYDVEESAAYKPARDLVEVVTGAKIVDNVDKNTQKDNKGDKKNEQKDNKDNKGTQDNKGGKKVSFPAAVLIPAETFNKGCKDDNKTCPNKKTEKCDKTDKGQKPCTKPAQKCAPAKTVAQAQAQKSESPKTGDAGIAYGVMGLLTSAGAFLGLRKKNHR